MAVDHDFKNRDLLSYGVPWRAMKTIAVFNVADLPFLDRFVVSSGDQSKPIT